MVNLLCGKMRDKVLYTRHIYYTDYSKLGCDIKYFNMVWYGWVDRVDNNDTPAQMRDPVDRFVSRYNFNRELLEIAKKNAAKILKSGGDYLGMDTVRIFSAIHLL